MRTGSRQPQRGSQPPIGIHTTEAAAHVFNDARTTAAKGASAKPKSGGSPETSPSCPGAPQLPRKQPWYGVLETSRGRAPVAFDPTLPQADKGQVYLLNLEREAIVPYQWSIVGALLREVDAEEQKTIRLQARKLRKSVQSSLLANRSSQMNLEKRASPAKPALPAETDSDDAWEGGLLDDMDFE